MAREPAKGALQALRVLNARQFPAFSSFSIDWEGRPIPTGFGPAIRRLKRAGDPETRVLDPDTATEAFLFHYRLGIHYGYPDCCVLQYAMEVPYVSPFLLRGGIVLGDHVPCDTCLEAYLLDYIRDGKAWQEFAAPVTAIAE